MDTTTEVIRIGIADDQDLLRNGLKAQLGYLPGFEVVGEAANGDQAVAMAAARRPDVLLMDLRMPGTDGIEATRRIVARPDCAGVRVLVLTTFDLDEYVYAALAAGASGFLLKDVPLEVLTHAVRVVAAGESMLAPTVTTRLIREFAADTRPDLAGSGLAETLTAREREILGHVAQGLSNAEIAELLVVSRLTVKTHVSRLLAKLGLRDRAQLVVAAYEAGLVVPGRPTRG